MKKNNLTKCAFAALLLASTVAGADQQYPAADFQPEVLYQDADYIAKNSPAKAAAKAPAAKAPVSAPAAAVTPESTADSKYPAADFQPEVLYVDPNYKAIESVKATVAKKEAASTAVESEAVSESITAPEATEEASMSSYLIGLVVLALAGFYFFKRRSAVAVEKKASEPAKRTYSLTGVGKYLNKISGTGVTRYLEKNVRSASVTGVAKYMAKQAASPKEAGKAATGVEKYMRDRG
ncbi:LPXTG cell wall anchor domain-containing protein [Methylobacter sp. S3L5C]|uniref:LPXTG cell wall anchor domain-containing protein n=1 Tax=Methylobacter sp. S3L5C TaxID=2839024 RepID=UPI001FACC653|nr:LPXTG cell wall anchor domain-containing protein [Methylobacter sp. S3L5C]UOA10002.1 LPXTG cell wall anchor domain-containing protein [Methylobacter sp. S3L5C]